MTNSGIEDQKRDLLCRIAHCQEEPPFAQWRPPRIDHGVVQSGMAEGTVTQRDIYRVHPWRNEILKASVSGTTLLSVLPKVTQCEDVSMSVSPGQDEEGMKTFIADGRKVVPENTYTVVTGDFTVSMCQPLSALGLKGTGRRIDAALLDHFRSGDRALQ